MSFEELLKLWDADLYDQTETETGDVELLKKMIGGSGKLEIFEAACGTGRILLPLVLCGHRVTGMDINSAMLSRLFEKAERLKGYDVIQDDLAEADWGGGYDLVVLAGNLLLNIVSSRDQMEAQRLLIRKAYKALKTGGYLFMDNNGFQHPERVFNEPGERVIFEGRDRAGVYGRYLLIDSVYDIQAQSVSGARRWELTTREGETYAKEETYCKKVPSISMMEQWLGDAGFEIEQKFGDYDSSHISEDTCRAIYWARKP